MLPSAVGVDEVDPSGWLPRAARHLLEQPDEPMLTTTARAKGPDL